MEGSSLIIDLGYSNKHLASTTLHIKFQLLITTNSLELVINANP